MPDEDDDEIEEINDENIRKLAQQVAGGGGGDEDGEGAVEETPDVSPTNGGAGTNGALQMDLERLKSTVDMLKEEENSAEDRMQDLSQKMGEVRQMVHEQDSTVSSLESEVDVLKDQVEDIEPEEFSKKLDKVESSIEQNSLEVEKVGEKLQRVEQNVADLQETLNDLGSLENLVEMNKEFEEKLSEIREAEDYIERLASKSEKINVKINKKLDEYSTYKAQVDNLVEKTSDMFRKLDDLSIDVDDAVKQEDLEQMRNRMHGLEKQLREYEAIAPLAQMSLPEPVQELREKREDIESFLESIEEQYENDKVSPSEYERIKDANEAKLEKINEQLVREWRKLEEVAEGAGGASGGKGPEEQSETNSEVRDTGGEGGGAPSDDGGAEDGEDESDEDLEILEQPVKTVKNAVKESNMDVEKLLEAEREGRGRKTLINWLESKTGD